MSDILDLDPAVLRMVATAIEGYCGRQTEVMNEFFSNVSAAGSEWTDDQTFGALLEQVRLLKENVVNIMDEIRATYPQYFNDKAEFIENRPTM